jgi:hypothetical protein
VFEIGNSLRAARERQGLGHAEIELATKIRSKYLRALEQEDFDVLPGDAYTRGFLRTYAEYLGLDGEIYVEEYSSRFLASRGDEPPPRHERPRTRRRERTIERRAVVLVLGGIALLTALVFVAWRYGGSSTPVPALTTTQQKRSVAAPHRDLVLRGIGRGTYVVVRRGTASGRVLLQGTVGRGEIDRLAGQRFYLLVRRPESLRVTLGGRAVALPSRSNLRVLVTPRQTIRLQG